MRKVTKLLCGSEDAKSILKTCYAAYQAQLETVFKNTEVKSSEKVKLEIIHSLKKQCKKNFHQGPRENAVTPCYQ